MPALQEDTRLAMVGALIALGLLEFLVALVSMFIVCCCANTYKVSNSSVLVVLECSQWHVCSVRWYQPCIQG